MPTLPQQFFITALRFPDKCALKHKEGGAYRELSFAQVADQVRAVGGALVNLGVKPGNRVAILSENRPEWVTADLGSMLAGAINVPIHLALSARLTVEILKSSQSRFLIVSNREQLGKVLPFLSELAEIQKIIHLDAFPENGFADPRFLAWSDLLALASPDVPRLEVSPDDVCSLLYTSGTTGEPKGVILTHRNLLANAAAALKSIPIIESDVLLSLLPLSHVYERTGGYYAPLLLAGASIAYAKSLKELALNMQEIRPTVLISVPRILQQLHDRIWGEIQKQGGLKLWLLRWALRRREGGLAHVIAAKLIFRRIRAIFGGRLRFAVSGAAALNPDVARFFQKVGIPIREGYGLTETSPVVSVNRPDRAKIGTVGPPLEGVEVKIAPDGEILVRGDNVTQGYWQNEAATRELLDEEGWLHTGDLGAMDEEGYLSIVGRKKELIVLATGKNVWPEPLEIKLNASRYILQSMIIGDGRPNLGALIVPDQAALREFLREQNVAADSLSLLRYPQVLALYRQEIDYATRDVAEYERIARFSLLEQEFTQEREEITPTLKLRRSVIAEHFRENIQKMYRTQKNP